MMTHRDKKPYQCMVTGCEKSYCDARSLKRHLENHHQHSSDQIAHEMVTAASQAADILAQVSAAQVVANKSPQLSTQSTTLLQTSPSESVIQTASMAGPNVTQIVHSNIASAASENNILAQQLLMNPTGTALVTLAVSTGHMSTSDVSSQLDQHQVASGQFETYMDQHGHLQLLQDQPKLEQLKIEPNDLEAFKVCYFKKHCFNLNTH